MPNSSKDSSVNLSKIERDSLLNTICQIKAGETVPLGDIVKLEQFVKDSKYGLRFEVHEEPVDVQARENYLVFAEDEQKRILGDPTSADCNFLLEGDNLHSLKLLEKTHKGAIDVIYIDPPYNTGKNDFVYSDKMVGQEDGYRHSKWLSFMSERLSVARKLLTSEGVIFISIDEYEFAQLKMLCDNIFGEVNYVENFVWIKNSTKNLSKTTSTNHEYILCYARDRGSLEKAGLFRVSKPGLQEVYDLLGSAKRRSLSAEDTEKELRALYKNHPDWKGISQYKNVEIRTDINGNKVYMIFCIDNMSAPKSSGVAKTYDVLHPILGVPVKVPSRGWAYSEKTMQEHLKNNNIFFYPTADKVPRFKRFLDTVETDVQKSYIQDFKDGKKELMAIFDSVDVFNNAKPTTLIKTLLKCMKKDAVVLDFFAGSGTTGQAVLELNEEDGGTRRFIVCTNNEIPADGELAFLHENGYMTDYNPSSAVNEDTVKNKIAAFYVNHPEVHDLLLSEQKRNQLEEYGICQSITYTRLKTVITGLRNDGSKYSDGLPANMCYLRTALVPKTDEDADEAMIDSSRVLVGLRHMSILDQDDSIFVVEDEDQVDFESLGSSREVPEHIYYADNIVFSAQDETFFDWNHVEMHEIPQCFYPDES